MVQNTSHAVMAQRSESKEALDDFPTPPWATRAFLTNILSADHALREQSCWEPACGRGDMSQVLNEYFSSVKSSDIYDYGYGEIIDFTSIDCPKNKVDWIITNPPFKLGCGLN